MAVHLPLSIEAQVEATVLMMSTNNIFSPANGSPLSVLARTSIMGCYYLSRQSRGEPGDKIEAGDGMVFTSPAEVFHGLCAEQAWRSTPAVKVRPAGEQGSDFGRRARPTRNKVRVDVKRSRTPMVWLLTTVGTRAL